VSHVYVMGSDSRTELLKRIECTDEGRELQGLLEHNLNLLPGDQISPSQNLRWLLIKREMPVVNPSSGENLWSIDFLLTDQDGVPTLVECKRHNDTRSRREVVGQMLEYAANGKNYWTASDFRSQAQNSAGDEAALCQRLKQLTGSDTTPEEFFFVMEGNLRRARMRLIFFLDDSPLELRSIVEFLNGQLKDTEVLIVEARQYEHRDARIVVPWVFGFTEEARVAKRESRAETERSSPAKGEAPFWDALAATAHPENWKDAVRDFVSSVADTPGCEVRWRMTCLVDLPALVVPQKTVVAVIRDGSLQVYLASWRRRDGGELAEHQRAAKAIFFDALRAIFGFTENDLETKQFPNIPAEKWISNATKLADVIHQLASSAPPLASATTA
jgi:hypothetical protein